jgi:hypothetical protein
MADAKKPAGKKPAAPSPASSEAEYVFFAVIGVIILFIIIPSVLKYFGFGDVKYSVPENLESKATHAFGSFMEVFTSISIFVSLIIFMGIIYAKFKYKEVIEAFKASQSKREEVESIDPSQFQSVGPDPRWQEIERHMATNSQAEWRVAIIESDIILFDMLEQMGYVGDTVAEKLKTVDKVNFATLDDAWRAHKIRNIIAHEGANYELSREEADRTIRLFKKVFEEFYFI